MCACVYIPFISRPFWMPLPSAALSVSSHFFPPISVPETPNGGGPGGTTDHDHVVVVVVVVVVKTMVMGEKSRTGQDDEEIGENERDRVCKQMQSVEYTKYTSLKLST